MIVDDILAGAARSAAPTWRSRSSGSRSLAEKPLQRIGLSATQRPLEEVGRFLVSSGRECTDRRCRRASRST